MSGFYEDGGVAFAKEQFDNVRKRNEKIAKKKDKASQKLLLADLAVKGFNMSLNNKYEKLAQEKELEMSDYVTKINTSNSFLKFLNAEREKGYNNEQILYNRTLEQYKSFFPEGYSVDGLEGLSHDFVKERLEAWENVIKHHEKVAGISPEELKAYLKTGIQAPRNLAEFFGNTLKKISMSHTDETLQAKDAQVKNQEINKIDLLGFGGLKNSLEEYNGVSSITALRKAIEENPEKYRPYKTIGEGVYIEDSEKDGNIVPSFLFTKEVKGADEPYVFDIVYVDSLSKPKEDNRTVEEKEYAIEAVSYKVFDIIKNSTYAENLSPNIKNYFEVLEDNQGSEYNVNTYRSTMRDIEGGFKHILKKHKNIVMDETLAIEIATINYHINKNTNIPALNKPSLYAVETILAEKTNQEPDLSNLQNWIDDLKNIKNYTKGESHKLRSQMLKELPYYIKDESEREAINKILSQNNLQSLEDAESDAKEDYIDNWDNLNRIEKQEYKNNRNAVFEKIEDELDIPSLPIFLNTIRDVKKKPKITLVDSRVNKAISNYYNSLTDVAKQKYGGVMPSVSKDLENYRNLTLDFEKDLMNQINDLNISEADFDASFYINNFHILN
tara:strand:+ start:3813 stop:5648 length:1836 start_codon:yes stop_codon:yes gene_type:complete